MNLHESIYLGLALTHCKSAIESLLNGDPDAALHDGMIAFFYGSMAVLAIVPHSEWAL